ncbi:MAG: hypothetical protein WDN31_03650 [Hyphomicrobium sp.]
MHGVGTKSILAAAVLAAGVAAGGLATRAQDAAPANSWQPIEAAPAAPPKPAEQLPKESTGDPATKSWAPPGLGTASPDTAPAAVCGKSDFEAVVDDAAGALRDLNMQNKPAFQEKLRLLKDKRGWSHDAFLKEAAPYVRDDKIAVYDQESERLLADISTLGQEGADAPTPDCALLADLKARMKTLVDTQTAKWSYMFQKLETALAQ